MSEKIKKNTFKKFLRIKSASRSVNRLKRWMSESQVNESCADFKLCSIRTWNFHCTISHSQNSSEQRVETRCVREAINIFHWCFAIHLQFLRLLIFSCFILKRINLREQFPVRCEKTKEDSSLFCFIQCFMLRYFSELFFKLSVMSSVYMRNKSIGSSSRTDLFISSFRSVLNVSWKSKQEIVSNNLY